MSFFNNEKRMQKEDLKHLYMDICNICIVNFDSLIILQKSDIAASSSDSEFSDTTVHTTVHRKQSVETRDW